MLSDTTKYLFRLYQQAGALQIDEQDAGVVVVMLGVEPYSVDAVHHTCDSYVGRCGKCPVIKRQLPKRTQRVDDQQIRVQIQYLF